jgi:hypothetical protein
MGGSTLLLLLTGDPVYASLLAAIRARVLATPALAALLPGGFHFAQADRDATAKGAYGVVFVIGQPTETNTSGVVGYAAHLQFSFFSEDGSSLEESLKPAWNAAFHPKMTPLLVQGEYMKLFLPSDRGRLMGDVSYAPNANPIYHLATEAVVQMGTTPP